MGYLSAILFEFFWTLDGIGGFILMEVVLKVLDGGLTPSSNGIEIGAVFRLLRSESFRKLTIPSCLGCGQCLVNAFLGVVSLLPQGGDEGLVSVFVVDSVA